MHDLTRKQLGIKKNIKVGTESKSIIDEKQKTERKTERNSLAV